MEKDDEKFMQQCIALAEQALESGNAPVGAVVVFREQVIGKGIESGRSTNDVTNHAEILAIKDAIENGHQDLLSKSKMYSTHEPCIMCSYVIRHHKIPYIIYGSAVPFIGGATSSFNVLTTAGVPSWGAQPVVIGEICAKECSELTKRFVAENAPK